MTSQERPPGPAHIRWVNQISPSDARSRRRLGAILAIVGTPLICVVFYLLAAEAFRIGIWLGIVIIIAMIFTLIGLFLVVGVMWELIGQQNGQAADPIERP
jgi:hypothetical protein